MEQKPFDKIIPWCRSHPGVFAFRQEGKTLILQELFSQKKLALKETQIQKIISKKNSLKPNEDYLLLLLESGRQLALSAQGFAFPPDFRHTGALPLPSQVYCLRDYQDLFSKLKWTVGEPERKREALDLVMTLIALLDGAKAVGLEVDGETQALDRVLSQLEKDGSS